MKIAERRRREIADTAVALIARDGLEALSLRAIAAEMDCSTGVLTHHFRDKAALIDFVLDVIIADLEAAARTRSGPATELATLVYHLLPHDTESVARWQALFAFTAASLSEPALRPANARREQAMRAPLTALLQRYRRSRSSVDDACDADLLLAMIDGLALRILLDPKRFTPRHVRALMRLQLDALGTSATTGEAP